MCMPACMARNELRNYSYIASQLAIYDQLNMHGGKINTKVQEQLSEVATCSIVAIVNQLGSYYLAIIYITGKVSYHAQ